MNNFKTVAFSMIILGNGQHHTYISIFSVFVCDYTTNQFCIYNLINLNEALLGRKLGLQNSKKNMVICYYLIAHMLKIKQWGANFCRSVVRSIQNLCLNRNLSLKHTMYRLWIKPWLLLKHSTYTSQHYLHIINHRWSYALLLSLKLSTSVSRSWNSCSVSCLTVVLAASDLCSIHDCEYLS